MWDFLFIDNESGEQFFVECDSEAEAWEIIEENFGNTVAIELCDIYTRAEADILGFDTY